MRTRRQLTRTRRQENVHDGHQKRSSLIVKFGFVILLIGLLFGNIFTFASSVKLTDSITKLEEKTRALKKDNNALHQKLYSENSLMTLDYIARKTGYTQQAEPFSLGSTDYAMAR